MNDGFDLAVAATSLHWVRLDVALSKLAQALRPGGWLAAWWTVFGDPERVTDFLVDGYGGCVADPYVTALYLARLRPPRQCR
jgi:SAM-dependent methyltransferase